MCHLGIRTVRDVLFPLHTGFDRRVCKRSIDPCFLLRGPCDINENVHSLLYDEASGSKYGPWALDYTRHRRQTTFWVYRGRQPAQRVYRGPHRSAARGRVHR
jgi:hypothetical protein